MKSATQTQVDLSEKLDKILLDTLENGQTALDDEGKVVKLTPSAALLNVARQRLRDCGVAPDVKAPGNDIGKIVDVMRGSGGFPRLGAIPPVDTEGDDAAVG